MYISEHKIVIDVRHCMSITGENPTCNVLQYLKQQIIHNNSKNRRILLSEKIVMHGIRPNLFHHPARIFSKIQISYAIVQQPELANHVDAQSDKHAVSAHGERWPEWEQRGLNKLDNISEVRKIVCCSKRKDGALQDEGDDDHQDGRGASKEEVDSLEQ